MLDMRVDSARDTLPRDAFAMMLARAFYYPFSVITPDVDVIIPAISRDMIATRSARESHAACYASKARAAMRAARCLR